MRKPVGNKAASSLQASVSSSVTPGVYKEASELWGHESHSWSRGGEQVARPLPLGELCQLWGRWWLDLRMLLAVSLPAGSSRPQVIIIG